MKSAPLTIAIDANEANISQRVGSNVYAHSLLTALEKISRARSPQLQFRLLLKHPPQPDLPPARDGWHYQQLTPSPLWTQWALPRYLFAHRQELAFFFSPGHYAPAHCPLPFAVTIMDLAYLNHPHYFTWRDRTKLRLLTEASLKQATHLFAISQATRRQLRHHYHLPASKISLAYPALNPSPTVTPTETKEILTKLNIQTPYFLYVGTLQPRKNIEGLVRAYELFVRRFQAEHQASNKPLPKLVLAGKLGWQTKSIERCLRTSSVNTKIQSLGFVSEREKVALYRHALASLNLSFEEGFGIPSLEALAEGCLTVVADNSSLPEVVGEAGFLVKADDYAAVAEILSQLTGQSRRARAVFVRAGRAQARRFNWTETAQTVLAILEKQARRSS